MRTLFIIFGLLVFGKAIEGLNQTDSCWEGRETIKQLLSREGIIMRESGQVVIMLPSSRKLFPCNLPDLYLSGDSVLFSADQKEIFPNERWEGRPVEITHIELRK